MTHRALATIGLAASVTAVVLATGTATVALQGGAQTGAASGGSAPCREPLPDPITYVHVNGNPFTALPSPDGCWLFVANTSAQGLVVFHRSARAFDRKQTVRLPGSPNTIVLTHDGQLLVASTNMGAAFLDVARLESGDSRAVLGTITDAGQVGAIYINVTADDRFVFVTNEQSASITVIDLARARREGFSATDIVGRIPVGQAPIVAMPSADGTHLFTTSEGAPPAMRWPISCRPEANPSAAPNHPQGAVITVDLRRAETAPAESVVAVTPAGCSPVRLVLSPKGDLAYVTARGDDAVLVFDTSKLVADPNHAQVARVPVGSAPVGMALIEDGKRLLATNSNRFATGPDSRSTLDVIDTANVAAGAKALVGTIPAGAFPRELRLSSDGKTLFLTNFQSQTVEVIDLARLHVDPPR